MFDIVVILLLISSLLVVVSLIQPLAVKLRLPPSVLLAVVGVAIGGTSSFLLHTPLTDAFNDVVRPVVNLPLRSATFIYIFLPLLLFQASLTLNVRRMMEDAAPILLLAVVAVFVATAVIGVSLSMLSGFSLIVCLLLGSIVATTDPAAVVAIFRDIGAPSRLTRLVEGESLLNDAAAIAVFSVLLAMLVSKREPDIAQGVIQFATSFAGGIAIGLIGGRLLVAVLPWLRDLRTAEMTLTLALPYLVFIISEHFLHVSGVVTVVTAGLTVSATGRSRLSPVSWEHLENIWEQIAFWAGSLVFILASILVPKLLTNVGLRDLLLVLALVVAALAARALVLFLMLPMLSALRLSEKVSHAYKTVILWGGLRGAVTLALALAITENRMIDPQTKRFVAVMATGFVYFTLLVNGTTLRMVIRWLGLDRLSPLNQALRNQVLALSLADVRDAVQGVGNRYEIAPPAVRTVVTAYEGRIAEVSAGGSLEEAISDRDRITIGLIALANRERELILEHHAQRTVSTTVVEILLRHATHILEAARTDGRLGYNRAARRIVEFPPLFRVAHFMHRRLRIDRYLTRQISERFEVLLVSRLVLEELKLFTGQRLKAMLGERVATLLSDILIGRHAADCKALDALRLQYPGYAEALERRFLRKTALRQEMAQYRALFKEGLLSEEIYDNLRRGVQAAANQHDDAPRLDLGLNVRDMVRQLDMFAGLDDKRLGQVCRLFRPIFAVPNEMIVRKGERGEGVYFISSGAVEVQVRGNAIRLGRGDIFGEMALLNKTRRVADIRALTYCQFLYLDEADFARFLKSNPDVKAHVDRIAEARAAVYYPGEAMG